jgi:hypothetical protein
MTLRNVSLDDKYRLETGRVFITGTQALVRLPLMQHLRDQAAGYSTAGYISGYRGSPLGQYDQQLWAAKKVLEEHHVVFQPGVNEDLAATAIWGTQQAHFNGENKYDGVFAIWYGKGPGVDRTGDAFRHGNLAGTHPRGGVLVLMGDDHTCESSTTAHQSEFAMVDAMIPILNPAGVQELLDYGIYGWALSRYSGCWVGLKCMKDTIDAAASVEVSPRRVQVAVPDRLCAAARGPKYPLADVPLEQEARLHNHKIDAVRAFARANQLDRIVVDAPQARLGIITCGKSYMDVRQALQYLGIDDAEAKRLGLRIYKVAMTWPLEPEGALRFAQGLSKVIVVEEKRGLIEPQLKDICYGRANVPQVVGKRDEKGAQLFQSNAALDPNHIAIEIGRRILELTTDAQLAARIAEQEKLKTRVSEKPAMDRTPYFCSGCPHNTGHPRRRGQPRVVRDRLSLHGAVDESRYRRLYADGRRGRELGRRGAVRAHQARVPEHRRRHLFSLGPAGSACSRRFGRERHLQDSVQRCSRDDRRAARRRHADRASDRSAGAGRRCKKKWLSSPTSRTNTVPMPAFPRAYKSITAMTTTRFSATCARSKAAVSSSTIRPAQPKSAAGANASSIRIPPSVW